MAIERLKELTVYTSRKRCVYYSILTANNQLTFSLLLFFLQANFEKIENELKEINTNQEALKRNFLELTELKFILRKTQQFFDEVRISDVFASYAAGPAHHNLPLFFLRTLV